MFELYNAHLRAEPAQGDVYKVNLLDFGMHGTYTSPPLPPNCIFWVKPGRGYSFVQVRSNEGGIPILPMFFAEFIGEDLVFHLTQESELNSD